MPRGILTDADAVIAVWGDMQLRSVDQATLQGLMTGQGVRSGMMIDFLGNAADSARAGLPVFRIAGGPGYYWAARYDGRGHGNLRFGMANAAVFDNPVAVPESPVASDATTSAAAEKQAAEAAMAAELARQALVERERLAREKEVAQQAARDAATARLKADRLAAATSAAKRKVEDAADFVKANRSNAHLLDHLRLISDLNASLNSTDPDAVEKKTAALSADLSADPDYMAFAARRDAERKRDLARDLDAAAVVLKFDRAFLIEAVTTDPTAIASATLLGLADQVDLTLAASDLGRAQTLIGTIDKAVGDAQLTNAYELAKAKMETAGNAAPLADTAAK